MRLWLRRYQQEGKPGLKERSRAPHHIPHQTPPEVEQRVLEARDAIPCFGPQRLKEEFGLPCSTGAIGRILRWHGRSRHRKKPRPPARSLAQQKMRWPPFGLFEMDVKDLQDLPGYRELIPFGLPRFQFTARMVPEGMLWLAFSAVNDSTYALRFADRLLAHLARCGVALRPLVVQTDHGSEFGGNWNRRHGLPPFTKLVEGKYGCRQHRFHPPHRSTYHSDVEAVHGIMEREFYQLERFRGSLSAFLGQAYSYQLYFNLLRRNSAKGGRTPDELRQARAPTVRPEISLLPPVMLSSLHAQDLPLPRQVLAVRMYLDMSPRRLFSRSPLAIPKQQLDAAAAAVGEDKDMAAQRGQLQPLLDQRVESIEALGQVGGAQGQVDAGGGGPDEHAHCDSSRPSPRRRVAASKWPAGPMRRTPATTSATPLGVPTETPSGSAANSTRTQPGACGF